METLFNCPFCGRNPEISTRQGSPADDFPWLAFVSCHCGGYSACAHKMAGADSKDEARRAVLIEWNTRRLLAERAGVAPTITLWASVNSDDQVVATFTSHISAVKHANHVGERVVYLTENVERKPPTQAEIMSAYFAHEKKNPFFASSWSFEAGVRFAMKHLGIPPADA